MNKIKNQFNYEYKYKYLIKSKIKDISFKCKNGCNIFINDNKIIIEAIDKNTILLAYELIKKEININKKNINNIKNDKCLIKNYDVLENDNIVNFIMNNTNL